MSMSKSSVKAVLGIKSDAELGRLLGVSRKAVWFWPDDDPLPELRQLQLRLKYPAKFPEQLPALLAAAGLTKPGRART